LKKEVLGGRQKRGALGGKERGVMAKVLAKAPKWKSIREK